MSEIQTGKADASPELRASFDKEISAQIAFQRRWRTFIMVGYVTTTVGTLFCTAATTITAALKMSEIAAILGAVSTVLVGTEKGLLFREKWKFHLQTYTDLLVLRSRVDLGQMGLKDAVERYAEILKTYGTGLPMTERDGASMSQVEKK